MNWRRLALIPLLVLFFIGRSWAPKFPRITLSPSSLTFTSQVVGTTSTAQAVTVTNSGAAAATIRGFSPSGYYSETNDCPVPPNTLAPGATCMLNVTFAPKEVGQFNGAITISHNGIGTPNILPLTGSGTTAVVFSPSSLNFGGIAVNTTTSAQTVTLTNNQSTSLNISGITSSGNYAALPSGATPCAGSIPANGTCTFSVTFRPTLTGSVPGAVSVSTDASSGTQPLGLSGSGTGGTTSSVAFSPASLDFGNQEAGTTTGARTVTITNNAASPVSITSVSSSGSAYPLAANGCTGQTIPAGSHCTFDVSFQPTSNLAPVSYPGAITVVDSDNTGTQVLGLSGTGVPPLTTSPSSVSFGSLISGQTVNPQTVTVINHHSAAEDVTIATAGDFALSANNNTCISALPAPGQCSFQLTFNPRSIGNITGAVTLTPSSGGFLSPQVVNLSGCQTHVSLTPTSLNFGVEPVGMTSGLETATLVNQSANALNITGSDMTGANANDFSISNNTCGSSVSSGASCTLDLTFTPGASGTRTGMLNISDDGACSPQQVKLTGGSSGPFTLTVGTEGLGTGTVISNPSGIDCGPVSICSASYNSGASVTLTATADATSDFTAWGERCAGNGACVLDMTADKQVTATFTIGPLLSVQASGNGSGTVTSTPPGIACVGGCSANFSTGRVVTLSAVADIGSTFTGWSGSCTGATNCTVTMNAPQSVTANFIAPDFSISASSPPPVSAGRSSISTVAVSSVNSFKGSVSLSCSVQSTVALAPTCSLNPMSVTPAANGTVTSQLTMSTTGPSASLSPQYRRGLFYALWLPLPGIVVAGVGLASRKRRLWAFLLGGLLFAGIIFQGACGGSNKLITPGTPPGSYTVTINAVSGSLQRSTDVTLTVN